ncbi:hypothetical protein F4804DRAFT_304229 [Jackrogersella minutella]|nr:hypothetical protein F4804DRAFT_304229 [Jackrogersella minutella]
MAKNKKGNAGPKLNGQRFPRRKNASFVNPSAEYSGNKSAPTSHAFIRAHGYTLADEARNTAYNRRGALGRDAKLRYKPVAFISAGFMYPLKDLNVQLATTDRSEGSTGGTGESHANVMAPIMDTHPPEDYLSSMSLGKEPSRNQQSTPELHTHSTSEIKSAHKSEVSSTPGSDCGWDSAEEVILFKGRDRSRQEPSFTRNGHGDATADSLKLNELDLELRAVEKTLQDTTEPAVTIKTDSVISSTSRPKGRGRRRRMKQGTASDEEAAVIADYIANMKDGEEEDGSEEIEHLKTTSHTFSILRDLGGTDSDAVPDDVSSADGMDRVSDETDSENQQHDPEAEDERVARLLAKQEELGLGGDDVLLFDGEASDNEWLIPTKAAPRRKRKGDSKKAKIFQKKSQYPSATQVADAFDDLDLIDWHRPSLNNFKKGMPDFDVSDSELEEAMKSAWQKDRHNKADKKKAREELRSQGLLGKNINPDDLRVKYLGGMSLDDLANELEIFLLGSQEQLILPPFDKGTRKTVHTLANKFKIKSQSAGNGQDRYPVLRRSKATLPFDQVTFDRTFGRIKQTWFPRVDVDEKLVNESRMLKRAETRNGKSRFKNSLTYRDGDVVGQHAAEIGVENRGRAMLEKMGWSKGMALGTGENKGIMVPITHVVKKSKAGLGDS